MKLSSAVVISILRCHHNSDTLTVVNNPSVAYVRSKMSAPVNESSKMGNARGGGSMLIYLVQ